MKTLLSFTLLAIAALTTTHPTTAGACPQRGGTDPKLVMKVYEGGGWNNKTILQHKGGNQSTLIEMVREILNQDKQHGYRMIVEKDRMTLWASAESHKRIDEFMKMLMMIPSPSK